MSLAGSAIAAGGGNAGGSAGPNIDIHVSAGTDAFNTVILGAGNVTVEQRTTTVSANSFNGYNASFVSSTASLTLVSINDESTPVAWGGPSLCLSATHSNFSNALTAPEEGNIISCSATSPGGPTTAATGLANAVYTPNSVGGTAVHMVEPVEAGAGSSSYSSYTIDASLGNEQNNNYSCTTVPFGTIDSSATNALCPIISPSPWNSVAINIIPPPPALTITKSPTSPSVVASQPDSFNITVSNAASPATPATGVVVTDSLNAAYLGGPVTFSGPNAADCSFTSPTVTCTDPNPLAAGGSITFTVNIVTLSTAGGTSPSNCAAVTATNPAFVAPANGCTNVTIIPPAVAWSKTNPQGNLWLSSSTPPCDPTNVSGQCYNQNVNTYTFDEVMTNQGDTHGLGAFSFVVHYDPTQYQAPAIDMSPAIALFAAAGRTLTCNIGTAFNGMINVACASTGTFGVGPVWVGPQVMGHVTLTPQSALVEAIVPQKENGDVSTVKDDQVTVSNTCGQPLNDGSIQPIPGQPECQGLPLQGVGPGGVLTGNPNGGESTQTIRRLEGDVTGDCSVTLSDMQLEASKYGTSTGSLLYSEWFDVSSPIQHGDGEIAIDDVQFVYGRFGSECSAPIPAQPAQAPLP